MPGPMNMTLPADKPHTILLAFGGVEVHLKNGTITEVPGHLQLVAQTAGAIFTDMAGAEAEVNPDIINH